MLEPGVAIVERNAAIESLVDLDFGSGETVAARLRMNLQPPAIPLHHVVVADDALMGEAADAFQILRRRVPGCFGLARLAREAAIVVGDEAAQHSVGRIDVASLSQAQLAAQAILEHAPEALDAAFGLRRLRGDESNAELRESATELRGLALASQLFVERPALVVASEDAAAIAVEGDGHTIAAQEALEQAKIACAGFRREELRGENFARGVVLQAQSGEVRAAAFQPVVRRAVELHEFSFAGRAQAALAMSGRSAFAGRAEAGGAQDATERFTAEREAFLFDELVVKVMVVETGVAEAHQSEQAAAHALGEASVAGPSAADVCQGRCAALPIARFEPFDLPRR